MSLFEQNPELLGPFREGRRDVLAQVYRAYVRSIERYIHSLSRASGTRESLSADALADLLQDIFIRAFSASARRGYDGARRYGPYLSAIARNCFIDVLRASGREVLKSVEELQPQLDDADEVPEPSCDPHVRRVLSNYIEELPASLTGVYQQRFVLGRSQDDASRALGISRRRLRTEEERLRSGLRRALQRAGLLRGEILEVS